MDCILILNFVRFLNFSYSKKRGKKEKKRMIKKYLIVSPRKRIDNMVLEFLKNKLTNEEKKKAFLAKI